MTALSDAVLDVILGIVLETNGISNLGQKHHSVHIDLGFDPGSTSEFHGGVACGEVEREFWVSSRRCPG